MRYPNTVVPVLIVLLCGLPFAGRAQHDGHHANHSPIQAKSSLPVPQQRHAAPAGATGKENSSHAGHEMDNHSMEEMSFAGIPESRLASGTAWQPDATSMHGFHRNLGEWSVMTHFNVFLSYDYQSGPRGEDQFNSTNWVMLMASRSVGEGELTFRTMLSLEPWTTTDEGYPLLFQTGEAFHGAPLIDRQHPHDLFMELAARYRHPLAEKTAFSLYVAASGEPALGPPAFPHRASAASNPAAPLSHHWADSSHISFGVITAGLSHDKWQFEGSVFNGREPDEERWGIDRIRLDSFAGRVTYNPTPNWSLQASHGYLHSPEELHPDEDVRRTTASVLHSRPLSSGGHWDTSLIWGHNSNEGFGTKAVLIESNLEWNRRTTIFGRAEYVQKAGEDLGMEPGDERFEITQLTLGAARELNPGRPLSVALGGSLSYSFAPDELEERYGDHPWGAWVFLRVRPAKMEHSSVPNDK